MKEILLINPIKGKKRTTKRGRKRAKLTGVKTMAKRKYIRRNEPNPRPRKRGRKRALRNPFSPATRSRARSIAVSARGAFSGLSFKGAFVHSLPLLTGMFAAKFAAKRFPTDDTFTADESDPETWNYMSYIKGAFGALAGGVVFNFIRPGWGQRVLEGGINLMLFKLVENKLVSQSEWAGTWFGQAQAEPLVFDETGTPYMLGEGEQYVPADERYRLPDESYLGAELEPVGPLGETLEPVGPLGADPWADAYLGGEAGETDPFKKAFF